VVTVNKIILSILGLILLYLVLVHNRATVNIIGALGEHGIEGIRVLQGR